jgi:hypothetical protein
VANVNLCNYIQRRLGLPCVYLYPLPRRARLCSDAAYVDLPLALLGAPISIGEARVSPSAGTEGPRPGSAITRTEGPASRDRTTCKLLMGESNTKHPTPKRPACASALEDGALGFPPSRV